MECDLIERNKRAFFLGPYFRSHGRVLIRKVRFIVA